MGRIPQEILDRIQDSSDIVDIISGYIPLKKAGANYRANCPFHKEKTPSFMISPGKQIFHCFGCGAGGDVVTFLMKHEGMNFREAVESLAKRLGIPLPEDEPSPENKQKVSLSQNLFKMSEFAANYYQDFLLKKESASLAREYLKKRDVSEEIINKFRLGFAPDTWDGFYNEVKQKGANLALMEKSGLVISREGKIYDRFRKRIMFPIFDIKSRPIAFGGRYLAGEGEKEEISMAKYINSPETQIYQKGKHLYGLNFSKDAIRENDFCIIVEGYMDLITPFQVGVKNIVASLGTALTQDQIRLLRRYTKKVVLLYDADKAGEAAALRGLDLLISEDMEAKVVTLAPGEDPDSYIKKFGKDEFLKFIAGAKSIFDYKFEVLSSRFDIKIPERKADLVYEMLSTIRKFSNSVIKSDYLKRLSERVGVSETSLVHEMNKIKDFNGYQPQEVNYKSIAGDIPAVEKTILKLILDDSKFFKQVFEKVTIDYFQDLRIKNIFAVVLNLFQEGIEISPNRVISHCHDEVLSKIVSELSTEEDISTNDKEELLNSCILRLSKQNKDAQLRNLQNRIRIAEQKQDEVELNRLMHDYNELVKLAKG